MLTINDYKFLINICQHSLRKGQDLSSEDVVRIDRLLNKLYNKVYGNTGKKVNALVRNKKMGKTTRV